MECKICNIQCIIPTTTITGSSQNVAVTDNNGDIICSGCSDAFDFASDIYNYKQNSIKNEKKSEVKVDKVVYYNCILCSNTFSGPKCECGFSNPLYRNLKNSKSKKKTI